MGQPTSKPVGERRAITESLALLVAYTAYTAFAYYVTFTWFFPLVDGIFGDVFILGTLCRGFSTVVYAGYVGVLLPYVTTVVFNKDEFFYRIPTRKVQDDDSQDSSTWLFILPWFAPFLALLIYYSVAFFVTSKKGRATAKVPTASKPPTPVKPVAPPTPVKPVAPPPRPIPPAKEQDDKLPLGARILFALLSPLVDVVVIGVLKDMEKQRLKARADRAASSRGATPSTTEQLVPTRKTKEPKKPLRKRVLSWFKPSKQSQPSGEKATTK